MDDRSAPASVGLEVRFDKVHAYIADMEAARREALANIEWPELDGHQGIPVLNMPLGSLGYVHAYMHGKTDELQDEVDANLSKLVSAKPSRRYTHALHHHAWAMLKHCMQHMAGYWLRNCLPSEVEAFAEAVDAGPHGGRAEAATLSEDSVVMARNCRNKLQLPTRVLKCTGIRRMATVPDAAFIGLSPYLAEARSFNATSSACQYDHFLSDARVSASYTAAVREPWQRLQAAIVGHLCDADARVMEREAEAASGSQKEMTAFLDQANNYRFRIEAVPLSNTVPMDELKDMVPDADPSLPAFNVVTGSYDPRSLNSTLWEFKTMRPCLPSRL
eukprot:jgi/Tetstr1/440929/TSEL_029198.t1